MSPRPMMLRLHAGQPTQPMIWRPALTRDGILTTSAADSGDQICFSRTALSCAGFSLEVQSGT
jgi:hypothetical protein